MEVLSMSLITTKQLLRVVHQPLLRSVRAQLPHFVPPVSHLAFHSRPIHSAQVSMGQRMDKKSGFSVNPYAYTSGRWLRHDKLECNSRYIKFDLDALCQRVIELCSGADTITSCSKVEGGFNRVFIFTLDTGKRIVARLPFPFAGPARLTTASEVATMRYLQVKTSIPLPTILDWSDDAISNTTGSEYIIMEHAPGVPLREKWQEMAGDEKVRCIDAVNRRIKEMVDLEFPAFGSIYFTDAPFDSAYKQPLDEGFCIGPHCNPRYWDCYVGERRYYHYTKPNHGPWLNMDAYCDGLIDAGLSRVPPVVNEYENRPVYHGSVQTHLHLLEDARSVLKQMSSNSQIQQAATPSLSHPDLHKRNLFVSENDPSIITCIIDWQAASIEPAFWYTDDVPDFAMEHEICTRAFEISSQFLTPKLSDPRMMDENLFRPFRYSYRTWRDGAVALRHELIQTARHWKDLGLKGQCPYSLPAPKELADHEKKYRLFEAAQDLKSGLSNLLDTASDGWMPPENWEATKLNHKELFHGMLQAVVTNPDMDADEPVRDERTLRSIWPFDIDG